MAFKIIDRENWSRKEYFEHYFSNVPCTYSMTTKLDITKIIKSKIIHYAQMGDITLVAGPSSLYLLYNQCIKLR